MIHPIKYKLIIPTLYNTLLENISSPLPEVKLKSHYLSGERKETLWNIDGAYKEALQ